jgi:dienelactone hydrolase
VADVTDQVLPHTEPLTMEGDIASHLVDAADAFLLGKLDESVEQRESFWSRDRSSPEAYATSSAPNRARLTQLLGIRDERIPFPSPELIATTDQSALIGAGDGYEIHAIRWPAFDDVTGEGLLLTPTDKSPVANVIAIPDADILPEQITGLQDGVDPAKQYARRLAEAGCCVVVPALIDRSEAARGISNREFIYRGAYELGRHLIGYELQKVLAIVDWFDQSEQDVPTGVVGWGEGGLLALYGAAVDERFDSAFVSGYFNSRQEIWQEPIERNVFGLLDQFGDAEIASLIAPRTLIVEVSEFPSVDAPAGKGWGAPCRLTTPSTESVRCEFDRALAFVDGLEPSPPFQFVENERGLSETGLSAFLVAVGGSSTEQAGSPPKRLTALADAEDRLDRQIHELDRHNQWLLSQCVKTRDAWFADLDCTSVEAFESTVESYRETFAEDAIGRFDDDLLPFNARSRLLYDAEGWKGYEVVLDVFPGLFAYGILGIPDGISDGEQRPVVVCQHGLEGRSQVVFDGSRDAYNDFGAELCKQGFVVFAPQNLYIFKDRFRSLQRKAYPLKKTLFSLIIPQHQQITDWLKSLPYVDPEHIAFYGISYGGKTAMRVPPLVSNYCLSICSADFNEWVWKNVSSDNNYSYARKSEYEIFEWDLGSTFNYAEMARLICPRPFMVERGHYDGVAPDETVAYEYAKVQRHYDLLGIGDRTELEVHDGGHEIRLEGTLRFLRKHLEWPER